MYRISDFGQVGTFSYDTEGWGLCDDGSRLVMSDGTSTLYFRDRNTFALLGTVEVTNDGEPVEELNELECVDGQVYANVYQTDNIVRIDPASGRVTAVIDASGLLTDGGEGWRRGPERDRLRRSDRNFPDHGQVLAHAVRGALRAGRSLTVSSLIPII